jgi:hypothetical protein
MQKVTGKEGVKEIASASRLRTILSQTTEQINSKGYWKSNSGCDCT